MEIPLSSRGLCGYFFHLASACVYYALTTSTALEILLLDDDHVCIVLIGKYAFLTIRLVSHVDRKKGTHLFIYPFLVIFLDHTPELFDEIFPGLA